MKIKNKVLVILMSVYFVVMLVVCLVKKPQEYSASERRQLQQFPKITTENVFDGTFMTDMESYALDQFPMRDYMRRIKAYVNFYGFRQKDNNDIYIYDGYVSDMEYPLDEKSVEHAAERFNEVYEMYLKDKDMQVAYSVIPDKNYFMAENSGHLSMDYDRMFDILKEEIDFMEYIDITNVLSIEDYYKTDTHWRQEKITDVADVIAKGFGIELQQEYKNNKLDNPFYGVYYGQAALTIEPEDIYYLTSDVIDECVVFNYENNMEMGVYDMEKAFDKDPYEIFLSGPISLMTIDNPNAGTDKELIIFRDSFTSSLAPLLIEGYNKITLIDIRYIQAERLGMFVDFDNQDVLFIYSTQVLNNSETIK